MIQNTPNVQNKEAVFAELVDRVIERLQRGDTVEIEQLVAEHPQHVDQLRAVWPALEVMGEFKNSATSSSGVHSEETRHQEPLGQTIGDFRIIREIGRGGMGVVYEGEQISLGRKVALKVLPYAAMLDSRRLQRFKNEAHAAATLHHNNIVHVYSIGSERSVHYYAMQFIEGQTLAQIVQDLQMLEQGKQPRGKDSASSDSLAEELASGDLPTPEQEAPVAETTLAKAELSTKGSKATATFYRSVAKLLEQACDALDYAHQNGVIHRDIKPSNLMVDADGRMWVTDFGLAQMECDAQITITGDIVGTLRYMSPEQALAKRVPIDHRTDIYSLGATLYELLTLQPVVDGVDRQQVLRSIAFDEPQDPKKLRSSIPADLATIALKALEKSPDARYQSAQEMADDIARYLNHEPIRAKRPGIVQRMSKWAVRHVVAVWALVAILLVCSIVTTTAAIFVWQSKREADRQTILAGKQRDQANLNYRISEKTLQYATDALRSPDPGRDGRTITIVEVLDQATASARENLDVDPIVSARIHQVIGKTFRSLGVHEKAVEALNLAYELYQSNLGENVSVLRTAS